jgi:hypothetical protein
VRVPVAVSNAARSLPHAHQLIRSIRSISGEVDESLRRERDPEGIARDTRGGEDLLMLRRTALCAACVRAYAKERARESAAVSF